MASTEAEDRETAFADGPADPGSVSPPEVDSARTRLLDLPGVIRVAFRLVWSADSRHLTEIILLEFAAAAAMVGELIVARKVIGHVANDSITAGRLAPLLLAVGILMTVREIATAATRELRIPLAEHVRRLVSDRVVRVATSVNYELFESPPFHNRLERARSGVDQHAVAAVWGVVALLQATTYVVGASLVLLAVSPVLFPLVLIGAGPLWWAASRNSKSIYMFSYDHTEHDRERLYLERVLTGRDEAKEVRIFRLDRFLGDRFAELWDDRIKRVRVVVRGRLRRALVATLTSSMFAVICLALLVWLAAKDRLDVAGAAVAILALRQVAASLRSVTSNLASLQEAALFFQDFVAFTALIDDAEEKSAPVNESVQTVEVTRVSFAYPGTQGLVLHDISLQLQRNKIVALVGANGSGKTTLAKLVCGLYRPTTGTILWDGVDIGADNTRSVHAQVAPIFQDFVRYELSARDNIVMADGQWRDDDSKMEAAAERAGADAFLRTLAYGYDTRLSRSFEGGAELSIGQWQRMAIARAFFRDAPLIVLDEPTAALDSVAEAELFQRLRGLAKGRAVLLISHRFSSVRDADEIIVMAKGSIVERGPHAALIELRGHYAEMFDRQAAAYRS